MHEQEVTRPFLWSRGLGIVSGAQITLEGAHDDYLPCLDMPRAMTFREWTDASIPMFDARLLFDLAGLPRPIRGSDAVSFVARHGLLWHGPESTSMTERFGEWESVASELYLLLELYWGEQGGAEAKRVEQELAGQGDPLGHSRTEVRPLINPPKADAWLTLAERINPHLRQVKPQLIASAHLEPEWMLAPLAPAVLATLRDQPGKRHQKGPLYRPHDLLLRDAQVKDLATYAYYELAVLIEQRLPLERCTECGKFFILRNQRMLFCSSQCRGRVQSRKYYARKRLEKV